MIYPLILKILHNIQPNMPGGSKILAHFQAASIFFAGSEINDRLRVSKKNQHRHERCCKWDGCI